MTVAALLSRLDKVTGGNGQWAARCPAHEDRNPSLSVTETHDRILVHCHAGCDVTAITSALGIQPRDLFADTNGNGTHGEFVAEYDYCDERGTVLFQVCRKLDKSFPQRRPDGVGGWTWGLGDVRRVPYRLPRVIEAVANGRRVFVVEGEKDVHSVEAAGLTATTCPGGAGKWRPEYSEAVRGADVVVCCDRDPAGYRHALQVAESLAGVADREAIVEPTHGNDVTDHLAAGRSVAELRPLAIEELRARCADAEPPEEPDTFDGSRFRPVCVSLADVTPERVEWLWPGRIPLGKLTVIDGDPGLGKSTLTLDLSARLSVGGTMPDGHELEAAGVVLATAEDGLADTVRPRLEAAGADCRCIVALNEVLNGTEPVPLMLPVHLEAVRAAVAKVDARLVVVDPLMAFLGGDTNSWRDQDIRRALRPLCALAEETGVALVVIRHLTKKPGGQALYRGGGSIGIVGAARSGLVVARDPNDDGTVILAPTKSNLSAAVPSLRYRLLSDGPYGVAKVEWLGESAHTADQLMAAPPEAEERSAIDTAVAFLRDALGNGPKSVREVVREARAEGISSRTLDRARSALGVRSVPSGFGGPRTLTLPDSPVSAKNPQCTPSARVAETEGFGGDCGRESAATRVETGRFGGVDRPDWAVFEAVESVILDNPGCGLDYVLEAVEGDRAMVWAGIRYLLDQAPTDDPRFAGLRRAEVAG